MHKHPIPTPKTPCAEIWNFLTPITTESRVSKTVDIREELKDKRPKGRVAFLPLLKKHVCAVWWNLWGNYLQFVCDNDTSMSFLTHIPSFVQIGLGLGSYSQKTFRDLSKWMQYRLLESITIRSQHSQECHHLRQQCFYRLLTTKNSTQGKTDGLFVAHG